MTDDQLRGVLELCGSGEFGDEAGLSCEDPQYVDGEAFATLYREVVDVVFEGQTLKGSDRRQVLAIIAAGAILAPDDDESQDFTWTRPKRVTVVMDGVQLADVREE